MVTSMHQLLKLMELNKICFEVVQRVYKAELFKTCIMTFFKQVSFIDMSIYHNALNLPSSIVNLLSNRSKIQHVLCNMSNVVCPIR